MEPKSRASSARRNVAINNSPLGSPKKKRKLGQEDAGLLDTMFKRFFFTLSVALLAMILSQYLPNDLLSNLWAPKKPVSGEGQGSIKSKSHSRAAQINLPSGYTPSCPIRGKESISAINRATTDTCKKDIADLACKTVDAIGDLEGVGDLYPTQLPNFCPTATSFNPELAGEYLGCHKDSFEARLLTGSISKSHENSKKHCIEKCQKEGYSTAGMQFGVECFCGEKSIKDLTNFKVEENKCNKKCPGAPSEICGGYLTMNLYHTGNVPSKPGPSVLPAPEKVPEDKQARIVYLLTINGRASRQVRRLIKQLYDGKNYFYIHVDSRQDYLYREMKEIEAKLPDNIYVTPNRLSTIWGGASLLTMLTACYKDLLQRNWNWDFVLNLSESQYPLKKREHLIDFLSNNKDKNFVKSHGREPAEFIRKQGLDKTFFECENHMWRLGGRKLPQGIQIDGGSDWVCLNKEFVSYVVNGEDELINGLRKVFTYTLLPAESFFHTTIRNSKFCSSYVNNNLHLTNWKRHIGCKCQHKNVVDWCGCSPNDITPEDWVKVNGTGKKQLFFGRKFEPIICQSMLDKIDQWISANNNEDQISQQKLDNWDHPSRIRYWQNIFHHLDSSPLPDTAVVEVSKTLSSVIIDDQLKEVSSEGFKFEKLLEVTSYHENDNLNGILLKFSMKDESGKIKIFEALVDSKMNVTKKQTTFRQAELLVGTGYDPKELIFRNFLFAMNENSSPMLMNSFKSAEEKDEEDFLMKIAVVDPNEDIVFVTEIAVSNGTTNKDAVSLEAKRPLMPGIWTTMVVNQKNNQLLAKVPFLVFPTKNPVEHKTNSQLLVSKEEHERLLKLFHKHSSDIHSNEDMAFKKLNLDRKSKEWPKLLVREFYSLKDRICQSSFNVKSDHSDNQTINRSPNLPLCEETIWSSLSPDPKSTISRFDKDRSKLL